MCAVHGKLSANKHSDFPTVGHSRKLASFCCAASSRDRAAIDNNKTRISMIQETCTLHDDKRQRHAIFFSLMVECRRLSRLTLSRSSTVQRERSEMKLYRNGMKGGGMKSQQFSMSNWN